MPLELNVGDIVRMKKPHPCGGYEWEILRTGADFRIRCITCSHMVMLSRVKFEKGVKKVVSRINSDNEVENL
ncbi:MAG: DUF951 domain-containing protein [Clostridiales bacterium]|nr:DUF951 domain-containing protein [Clostridiales bacterium]